MEGLDVPLLVAAGVGGALAGFVASRLLGLDSGAPATAAAAAAATPAVGSASAAAAAAAAPAFDDGRVGECKMVLCVRTDLKMTKGKIGAQIGHAVLGGYKRAVKRSPEVVKRWEKTGQAKVAVKVGSEEELLGLSAEAEKLGVNTYVVADAGRTQIASGSLTVLCVGPDTVANVNRVTSALKLL